MTFHEDIRRQAASRTQDILTAVFDEVDRFRRGMPFHEGITLVVVKIEK